MKTLSNLKGLPAIPAFHIVITAVLGTILMDIFLYSGGNVFLALLALFILITPLDLSYYKSRKNCFLFAATALSVLACFTNANSFNDFLSTSFVCILCMIVFRAMQLKVYSPKLKPLWLLSILVFLFSVVIEPVARTKEFCGKKNFSSEKFLIFVAAFGIVLIVSTIFITIFSSASPQWEPLSKWISENIIGNFDFKRFAAWLLYFILLFAFFGMFFYTKAINAIKNEFHITETNTPQEYESFVLKNIELILYAVGAALVVFNIIFAIENYFNISYFIWGLDLPKGFTHKSYAEQGANSLATAIFVAAVILAFLNSGNNKGLRAKINILVYIWILQNFLICISAFGRLASYVSAYDFTLTRLNGMLCCVLLFVGLIISFIKIFNSKSLIWLVNTSFIALCSLVILNGLWDKDRFVANYNVDKFLERHAENKTNNYVDIQYILTLDKLSSLGARLKLHKHYQQYQLVQTANLKIEDLKAEWENKEYEYEKGLRFIDLRYMRTKCEVAALGIFNN